MSNTVEHFIQNTRFKIETPSGMQLFAGIRVIVKPQHYVIELTNGKIIKSSETHIFITVDNQEIQVNELEKGLELKSTTKERIYVENITFVNEPLKLYDVVEVEGGNLFNVDGIVSHNCDFSTSGDLVFYNEFLEEILQTTVEAPLERRGFDQNLWVWEPVDFSRNYMVVADVGRGDGRDNSAFHVIDIDTCKQVAEYRGQIAPKDYGHLLVGIAYEYNEALLIVENANIGWSTVETVLERGYTNLYYSPRGGNQTAETYFDQYDPGSNMVAGFTTSTKTRPLIISNFRSYVSEQCLTIKSKRLIDEMKVFIWKNGKAEAQSGYTDDLVMSFGVGLYVRDTALKFRNQGSDLAKAALSNIHSTRTVYNAVYNGTNRMLPTQNPYMIKDSRGNTEDYRWILDNRKG